MEVHTIFNTRNRLYWHAGQTGYKPTDVIEFNVTAGTVSASNPRGGSGRRAGPAHSPTCHDINLVSRSPTRLEVAVGYTSGEVVMRELRSGRSTWLVRPRNAAAAITTVQWIPGTELLMVADASGGIVVYDKDRRLPKKDRLGSGSGNGNGSVGSVSSDDGADMASHGGGGSNRAEQKRPKGVGAGGLVVQKSKKGSSTNPVSEWSFGWPAEAIYDISFSPDTEHVAFVGAEGVLRVCHYARERQVIAGGSFFGELYCTVRSVVQHASYCMR